MTAPPAAAPPRILYWRASEEVKGFAIVLMVIFHFTWDLSYFGVYRGNMLSTPWQTFARSIASTFIFVMGVSMTLSYHRLKAAGRSGLFWKYLRRGGKIFAWGIVITAVTYVAVRDGFVVFGILHLLGASLVLAYPFVRFRWGSLAAGIGLIGAGVAVNRLASPSPWLLWLGVKQFGRYMVDYYPLLPWSGLALVGVFAGQTLYPAGRARVSLPDLSGAPVVRGLSFLGRHSLVIYLLHQPLLLATLILLGVGTL
ncbi:MAG: heparan-alpha-glucosaminide N-acetyltransferase [Anaerolineae bacterium]